MDVENKEDVDPADDQGTKAADETTGVAVTDHLLVRDKATDRILVNVRDTSKNIVNTLKNKE